MILCPALRRPIPALRPAIPAPTIMISMAVFDCRYFAVEWINFPRVSFFYVRIISALLIYNTTGEVAGHGMTIFLSVCP